MMYNVKQMYSVSKESQTPLLSNFSATFWNDYTANYQKYDKLFARLYSSFRYFMQTEYDTLQSVTSDFIDEVYNHLLINEKKYAELYRIEVIDDVKYSLTDNYDMTEIMQKSTDNQNTATNGQRTDINNLQVGSQNSGGVNKVTGWNSANENVDTSVTNQSGTRQDISQFTKGQETDTSHGTGSENYTLTRKGNIGVMTATDMIDKHKKFWTMWDFYAYIFNEICVELLLV